MDFHHLVHFVPNGRQWHSRSLQLLEVAALLSLGFGRNDTRSWTNDQRSVKPNNVNVIVPTREWSNTN